jgi:GcvH upstream region-like protein
MLELLRKYQKSLFLVVAIVVISSFVFFGTFSAMMEGPTQTDRIIGRRVDGSPLQWRAHQALVRFLAVDREDSATIGRHAAPNLLNDGVLKKDFLRTGIAETLAKQSWDLLKNNFAERMERIQKYKAYEHPDAPFISARAVWERFAPAINREWSEIQAMNEPSSDLFARISHLYYLQTALPAEWLRHVLTLHQQQYSWLAPDPRLREDDLSLFGFRTATDWFGKDFIDLVAEFIENGAIEAERQGYAVSLVEAKAALRQNFEEARRRLQEAKLPFELSYADQLRALGLDEGEAAALWRKVMLMRRYFGDIGEAVLIDRLPYDQFTAVASETAKVVVYEWPSSLKMTNALDLLAFETYLKAVAPPVTDLATLPRSFFSPQEAAQNAPELVATEYTAKVAVIDKRETSLTAPLKEVWRYESQEEGWKQLRKEFAFLQHLTPTSEEERFKALETLDPVNRGKVDLFARRRLLDRHPEWIDDALTKAVPKETSLILSGGAISLPHVADPKKLGALFEQIPTRPEEALSELQRFDSGDAVFRFENIAKISDPKIKTFEQARRDGSLARIVDRALQQAHPRLKSRLAPEKQALAWTEVKEDLAELLLSDMKKQILKTAPKEETHFASCRLLAAAHAAQELVKQGGQDCLQTPGDDPLVAQFKLVRTEREVPRTAEEDWMTHESFERPTHQWSPVHVAEDGSVQFIYLEDRLTARDTPILEHLNFGKMMLVSDAQRILAQQLLAKMRAEQAIVIPVQPDYE